MFFEFFKLTRVLNISVLIANSTFNTNTKAIMSLLKIVLYFILTIHFMTCIWWWTIVHDGSPWLYGQNPELNGYTNHHNDLLLDDNGALVEYNQSIRYKWGSTKYFKEDHWKRS